MYPISTNTPSTSSLDCDDEDEDDLVLALVRVNDSTFNVPLIAFTIELEINDTLFSSCCNNLMVSSVPIGVLV